MSQAVDATLYLRHIYGNLRHIYGNACTHEIA
jgi:hypothetical protein